MTKFQFHELPAQNFHLTFIINFRKTFFQNIHNY